MRFGDVMYVGKDKKTCRFLTWSQSIMRWLNQMENAKKGTVFVVNES